MERKKKKTLFILVLLLLVGLTSGYVANTYAKYASDLGSKQASASVAKWNFDAANTNAELTVKLNDTYNADTLKANKIAPGTEGSFEINLVNTDTETGVNFTATVENLEGVPTNLKFYTDESRGTEFQLNAGSSITGQLAALDETGVTIPIYWKWDYNADSTGAVDTPFGKNPSDLSLTLNITGVQMEPSTSTSTTDFKSKVEAWTN